MIRFLKWGLGLLAFSVSASAFAQDGGGLSSKQIRLGVRLGYALPMGDLAQGSKMSDGISSEVPIWLDAGYMVTPNLLLGAYGRYGFVTTKACSGCSAHNWGIGVQGQYHILPAAGVDPWLGLGFGYEVLGVTSPDVVGGGSVDGSLSGLEFLTLQGGADFALANVAALGPFVSFSLGKYSSASEGGVSADIPQTAMHEWLTLGVKGTFGL